MHNYVTRIQKRAYVLLSKRELSKRVYHWIVTSNDHHSSMVITTVIEHKDICYANCYEI